MKTKHKKLPARQFIEWQPIETAPKKCMVKIIVSDGNYVDMAYWDYNDWCAPHSSSNNIPYQPTLWAKIELPKIPTLARVDKPKPLPKKEKDRTKKDDYPATRLICGDYKCDAHARESIYVLKSLDIELHKLVGKNALKAQRFI